MKAFIVRKQCTITPFLEDTSQLLVGNKIIGQHQKDVFQELGLKYDVVDNVEDVHDGDERIVVEDNVYFTAPLIKQFVSLSRSRRTNTLCAVHRGNYTIRTFAGTNHAATTAEHVCYGLSYFPSTNQEAASPVVINLDQRQLGLTFPDHMYKGGNYFAPYDERVIVQVDHWTALWSANLVHVLAYLCGLEKGHRVKSMVATIRSFSFNKWSILGKLNKVGIGCDIHPKAYLEGCIIGDKVTVGAGTTLRHCMIGDNATVGNGVTIESSVIGEKCVILNGHVLQSVFLPETFSVAHFVSASLLGRRSFVGSGAILTDFRFDGRNVSILKGQEVADSGNTFLGCCLGNDVYLGGGCVVAPGREIANRTRISPDKSQIITKTPQEGFRISK